MNPWSLIIALDKSDQAAGELYLDDGLSLVQKDTKEVEFRFTDHVLYAKVTGTYQDTNPLANVTIAGVKTAPKDVCVTSHGKTTSSGVKTSTDGNALYITGLESATKGGAWSGNLVISLEACQGGKNGGDKRHWGDESWWSGGWKNGGW